MAIDERLLDCDTQPEIEENFNRTLALVDAGGGGGYDVETETTVLLPSTEAEWGNVNGVYMAIASDADGFSVGDTVRYVIDGQTYDAVARAFTGGQVIAGGFDPETAVVEPSVIFTANESLAFVNATAPADPVVSAERIVTTVTVTDDFKEAVSASGVIFTVSMEDDGVGYTLDSTWQEILNAVNKDKKVQILQATENGIAIWNLGAVYVSGNGAWYNATFEVLDYASSPMQMRIYNFNCNSANDYPVYTYGGDS